MFDRLKPFVKGVIAASPELEAEFSHWNSLFVPGIIADDIRFITPQAISSGGRVRFFSPGVLRKAKVWISFFGLGLTRLMIITLTWLGMDPLGVPSKKHGGGPTFSFMGLLKDRN